MANKTELTREAAVKELHECYAAIQAAGMAWSRASAATYYYFGQESAMGDANSDFAAYSARATVLEAFLASDTPVDGGA